MQVARDFSDSEYLLRLQANDDQAFNVLFHRYAPGLCHFAQSHLKSPEEAEEIVQECFLKLWQKRQELAADTVFKSYLYTAAYHSILNQLRRRQYWTFEDYPANLRTAASGTPFEYQELEQVYHEAITRLPVRRRQIFSLSRQEGMSYAAIAQELNISVKSVETQMSLALKFLRAFLKQRGIILGMTIFMLLRVFN